MRIMAVIAGNPLIIQCMREKDVYKRQGRDTLEAEEADIVKEFEAEGMNVTELTEEELDAFKESISGMKQEFIKKYGEKACEAFDIEEE